MRRLVICLVLITLSVSVSNTQKTVRSLNAQNKLFIITLDGFRWEEMYRGADSAIITDPESNTDTSLAKALYWDTSADQRRKKLLPFCWSVIARQGELFGNRDYGNRVNVANPYALSYPGYSELLTGDVDYTIYGNDKTRNSNKNVLQLLNKSEAYAGKVAAFTSWDVFPYILNDKRSGIYVNSDVDTIKFKSPQLDLINDIQFLTTRPIGVRPDVLTYIAGREYLKAYKPKVLYIAFDETDDFAHGGEYDQYLKSAHAEDGMIKDLWNTLQSMPQYKGKTSMIVATDHGRGDQNKDQWRDHGQKVPDASQIWLAVIGPDTRALGEVKDSEQLYQRQLATTIAALLGLNFKPEHEVMDPIQSIVFAKSVW